MTPERYQKAGHLYHAALEIKPEARAAFLDEACGKDEELRREAESLLRAHDKVGSYFTAPALEIAAGLLARRQDMLLAGQGLSHYRVLSLIGAGGMGEVYLAEDTRLGRKVALKLLPREFTEDPARVRRFELEARAASSLNHPNIVTIFELGKVDGRDFIATEYVDGQTLRARLSGAHLEVIEALDVAAQIASALEAAHEAGIVHRDIKPENVMARPDGLVKILDFGLAKLAETKNRRAGLEATTVRNVDSTPGMVLGTVSYMSPEQARGLRVDARSDNFSLGVVLYEMLAGRVPFEGPTPRETINAILENTPLPLVTYEPNAPEKVQWIVNKALRKDREERYQSTKEMLSDLREVKQELELKTKLGRSGSPEMSVPDKAVQFARARDEQLVLHTADKAVVRTDESAARPTSSAEVILSEIKRHKTGATVSLLVLLLLVAGIGYGLYRFLGQPKPVVGPFQTLKMTKLNASGKARDAAISHDGKYVVYVEENAKQQSLWISQVATGSNFQIVPPAQVSYYGLTFSNDSNYIHYTRTGKDDRLPFALYKIPSLGGTSRKLIEHLDSAVVFSPDGHRFAFVRAKSPKETSLLIANADGSGERTIATRMEPEFFVSTGLVRIAWSPDGKIVACPAGDNSNNNYGVVGVSVEDGSESPLTSQKFLAVTQVAWLSGGSGLAMLATVPNERSQQLWHLSYPGAELRRITNDVNQYASLSLTEDSNALVTVQSNLSSRIWIAPKDDVGNAKQISSGKEDGIDGLLWTPDGRIIYQSRTAGDGRSNIWVMNADGSNQRQRTYEGGFSPSVSPDGRYIVFASRRADTTNIWRVDIDGGNQKQLTDGKRQSSLPCVSRDGRWVVYTSWELGLWKVPFNGGTPVFLSNTYAASPVVSPDGTQIAGFYVDEQANPSYGIVIFPFDGGPPAKRLKTAFAYGSPIHWTPDGRAVRYIDAYQSNIWSQPVDGGKPVQLTAFQGDQLFNFDYSPDGKWLAFSRGRETTDVLLINNSK